MNPSQLNAWAPIALAYAAVLAGFWLALRKTYHTELRHEMARLAQRIERLEKGGIR